MPENLAPIVLFAYNRPWHLKQTVDALRANAGAGESELYIFSDGAKNDAGAPAVQEVRDYLPSISGFRKVHIHISDKNLGLAASVIRGVSQVIGMFGKVIVMEDDMLTTPDFLHFMNQALDIYAIRQDVFSVTGYGPPFSVPAFYQEDVYLAPRASSWGWGTWKDRWQKADWEVMDYKNIEKRAEIKSTIIDGGDDLWPMLVKQQRGIIDSWAIRWTYTQRKNNAYGMYPVKSKIKNIGTDGSGTNFTFKSESYGSVLSAESVKMDPQLQPDAALVAAFRRYYQMPFLLKLKNKVKYRI